MKKIFVLIAGALAASSLLTASGWQRDILGGEYKMRYVDQGEDYDGKVRSTIITLPIHNCCDSTTGVLYVHGYNDYFLQKAMGERFADSCYRFFAVDLRRYGRSLLSGQRKFDIHDMSEYFPDIDSAIAEMKRDGVKNIILMGHSTGGLTTSLYMNNHPDPAIKALILNSPFLDWNQSKIQESVLLPLMSSIGEKKKYIRAVKGSDPIYHAPDTIRGEGEWNIIREMKPEVWPDITSGWISAIDHGQDRLRNGRSFIKVPILLMHSDKSFKKGDPESMHECTDDVLNVADISKYGRQLGPNITEVTVPGGTHDLVRSAPAVREAIYQAMFRWLKKLGLVPNKCGSDH